MPLPPRRPRKHATVEEAKAASLTALELYRPKPGQSGNPQGFPRSRREQLETIERLAREASPEMIEILQEMARNSEDDRVRTMAATKLLEFVPKLKEDSGEGLGAKFEKMSPRELREWLIQDCKDISQIEVPEGYVLSPEDNARHSVVRAALAMAVHGIGVLSGQLVDDDAAERHEDDSRQMSGHPDINVQSQAPKCRTCGKAEWGHVCSARPTELTTSRASDTRPWIEIGEDFSSPRRPSSAPAPAVPRPSQFVPDLAELKMPSRVGLREMDDAAFKKIYNAVEAERKRRYRRASRC